MSEQNGAQEVTIPRALKGIFHEDVVHLVQVQRGEHNSPFIISREKFHPVGAPRQRSDGAFMEANDIKTPQLHRDRQKAVRSIMTESAGPD